MVEPDYIEKHFVPVALDTYFRGNSHELEFCDKVRAGGNHVVVTSAGGTTLGGRRQRFLRKKDLDELLVKYKALPEADRKPRLPDPKLATPARRKTPTPPEGGLVVRGYCTYMKPGKDGKFVRSKEFYYKENPDRWAAETQSDMLWLTRAEAESLVPRSPRVGKRLRVPEAIQTRFFTTIGIDYMEGSVCSLPARDMSLSLKVTRFSRKVIEMRADGYAHLGKAFAPKKQGDSDTRGCEVRVVGHVHYDREKKRFTRFDLVGIGKAWGVRRNGSSAVRIGEYPWTYGIACELVRGDSPMDRIPPYNLLHYASAGPYFGKR